MSPGDAESPALDQQDEATSTTETSTRQGTDPVAEFSAAPSFVDLIDPDTHEGTEDQTSPDWAARRVAVQDWLPGATRVALETFALTQFDRAEIGWLATIQANSDAGLIAQRDASYSIADALDWRAASRRPSHDQLVRRRAEIKVPR